MRCALSLLFLSNIAHDHSSVASKFGRGKMAENHSACVQQFRDWVEDVCFPLFHCFFEMCATQPHVQLKTTDPTLFQQDPPNTDVSNTCQVGPPLYLIVVVLVNVILHCMG